MTTEITFQKLTSVDKELIEQIAQWYFSEWNIPKQRTIDRLAYPNDDILLQIVLNEKNKPVATGGLYNNVGLLMEHPRFKKYGPWVALLYTDTENRNRGWGEKLLQKIENEAKRMNVAKIYLYTYTAEMLYRRAGWTQIERVDYKGHDTVVMEKEI